MSQSHNIELKTKRFCLRYLDQILEIERNVHINPWSKASFESCFKVNSFELCGFFKRTELIGYCVIQVAAPEAEILNFAIAKDQQSLGYGRQCLLLIEEYCSSEGQNIIRLEVRQSNSIAISLYTGVNFIRDGLRKNYYQCEQGTENALLFIKYL